MCVSSFIYDHFHEKWSNPPYSIPSQPYYPNTWPNAPVIPTPLTPDEVEDVRKLLEKAKQYDEETGQKDCELEEKKQRLRLLAKELGVEITLP